LRQTLTCLWKEPDAPRSFRTGVSLHSHTNHSRESLRFILQYARKSRLLEVALRLRSNWCAQTTGVMPDLRRGYWTPPLPARAAFELERGQIENALDLDSFVSLTDHDNVDAPLLLRVVPEMRDVPISTEWTLPYGAATFHLGIHNLPAARAISVLAELQAYTKNSRPADVRELLVELHADPDVLVVLNHPLWDLTEIGEERHRQELGSFLQRNGAFIHALEISGVRTWPENKEVLEIAAGWNQLVISGGDRHGCEPNSILNLTHTRTFAEFVRQIRRARESHVLLMPQYAEPMALRVIQTLLDVIRFDPDAASGAQRWDDRVLHPNLGGVDQPLSSLWNKPPAFIEAVFAAFRLFEVGTVRRMFRIALRQGQEEIGINSAEGQEVLP
jgi:hypothetical protein